MDRIRKLYLSKGVIMIIESIKIDLNELYEKAIQYWEYEDNYSNRIIVAVFPEENNEGYYWGSICVKDEVDIDPEDYPKFNIRNRYMTLEGAKLDAERYFESVSLKY
jgi:hypothetical protein